MSNSHLFLKPVFITTPSQNGVGRYVCQLQRIVLKFCKNHGASRGMREFIESNLIDYAKYNPGVVVYLKPRRHRAPVIVGEYLNGDRQWISARNFTCQEISKWLNLMKTQSGDTTGLRFRQNIHTDNPSIQGPWTPYTFRDPAENLADYPDQQLALPRNIPITGQDQLLELFNRQKSEEPSRGE